MPETTDAGAMPAAAGAMPAQTTPVSPATAAPAATTAPATGADEPLQEPGLRALQSERDRAAAAERERDEWKKKAEKLEKAGLSESERAIADAKKAGAAEVTERFQSQIRRSEVRSALTGAGISASVLDLATKADEFAALKVDEDGNVAGLDAAVKAFKDSKPDLFTAPKPAPRPGDAGLGPRGTPSAGGMDLNTFIRKEAGRA